MGEAERKGEPLLDEETAALLAEQRSEIKDEEARVEQEETRASRPAKAWLFIALLLSLGIAVVSAVTSESALVYGILGLLPTILACIVFIFLLEGDYKDALFWIVPLALGFIFLAATPPLDFRHQLDVPVLTAVNMVLSYIILGVMLLLEYRKEPATTVADLERFEPKELPRYLHTIEEKCKALNFSIGRVYRASNGGTAQMRDRIKVSPEWYNEFHAIDPKDEADAEGRRAQKEAAHAILAKIEERLTSYLKPEKEVFTDAEVKGLKHLARDRAGKDRILDVLAVNDSDPVEEYYLGALEFCRKVSKELEKL